MKAVQSSSLVSIFPSLSSSNQVFASPGGSDLVSPSNWFPLTRVKWLPLIANSLAVLGIVIAELGVGATTRSATHMGSSSIRSFSSKEKVFLGVLVKGERQDLGAKCGGLEVLIAFNGFYWKCGALTNKCGGFEELMQPWRETRFFACGEVTWYGDEGSGEATRHHTLLSKFARFLTSLPNGTPPPITSSSKNLFKVTDFSKISFDSDAKPGTMNARHEVSPDGFNSSREKVSLFIKAI
ncbi:hypothetical protein Tco_1214473 [Tanacetum coccineum]